MASFFCYTNFLLGHYLFDFLSGEDIVMIAFLINLFHIYILKSDFKYLDLKQVKGTSLEA